MIKFTERTGESTEKLSSTYKDIKPVTELSKDKAYAFWDNIFEDDYNPDEAMYDEIYGCYEDDFKFDFDVQDSEIQNKLSKFSDADWTELSEAQQKKAVKEFTSVLCEKLELKEMPKITYYEADENDCGFFNPQTNTIAINSKLFNNPKEMVDTIAHELRHAYQHQRVNIGETHSDKLYAFNFDNYITPETVDGAYINYFEYSGQFVEAEARAFAKLFEI